MLAVRYVAMSEFISGKFSHWIQPKHFGVA